MRVESRGSRVAALLGVALLLAGSVPGQEAARSATVTFLDGSTLPLTSWTLSYDFVTWPHGGSQLNATARHTTSDQIWIGRKAFPAAGAKVSIAFSELRREVLVDGRPQYVVAQVPREVTVVTAEGRTSKVKMEPPSRDALSPGLDKKTMLLARSLDLVGQTVTGGKRTLCLLSFSTLVDCGTSPADVVAKVEFAR